jgi:hypothetical protein
MQQGFFNSLAGNKAQGLEILASKEYHKVLTEKE